MTTMNFLDVEDLEVYRKLCRLHIEVCDLTHGWPKEEKYELGSQARRSSNSAPAQLAEKNDEVSFPIKLVAPAGCGSADT